MVDEKIFTGFFAAIIGAGIPLFVAIFAGVMLLRRQSSNAAWGAVLVVSLCWSPTLGTAGFSSGLKVLSGMITLLLFVGSGIWSTVALILVAKGKLENKNVALTIASLALLGAILGALWSASAIATGDAGVRQLKEAAANHDEPPIEFTELGFRFDAPPGWKKLAASKYAEHVSYAAQHHPTKTAFVIVAEPTPLERLSESDYADFVINDIKESGLVENEQWIDRSVSGIEGKGLSFTLTLPEGETENWRWMGIAAPHFYQLIVVGDEGQVSAEELEALGLGLARGFEPLPRPTD